MQDMRNIFCRIVLWMFLVSDILHNPVGYFQCFCFTIVSWFIIEASLRRIRGLCLKTSRGNR